MRKPSSKIREEIARLQAALREAETREAERIGRLALKAGLGEVAVADEELIAALEELAERFRGRKADGGGEGRGAPPSRREAPASITARPAQGSAEEA